MRMKNYFILVVVCSLLSFLGMNVIPSSILGN